MAKCCEVKRACDLRHAIIIQEENATDDGGGGLTNPWANPVEVARARSCIEPLRGFERLRAQQLESPVTHKITLRYRAGIKAQHRILFGTRVFNIRSVINIEERNRWLEIMADEGVAF